MNRKLSITIKALLGILWTTVFAVGGMMLFMGNRVLAQSLLIDNNVQIISKYTGGETSYEKDKGGYLMVVREPVRDGVFNKTKKSFVQVDWFAKESLPGELGGSIDIDSDGRDDLLVDIDIKNNKVTYEVYGSNIEGLASRSAVTDYIFKRDEDGKDALYHYRNRSYGGIVYKEGISVRIIIQ
ncbi:MAG TPA: hypothetical protein VHT96_03330 [Clostridia bacterium]|nr:hypothetical protein [Clostridia bacterium]